MVGFESLSVEVQLELLGHMDPDTLAVMSRTNKRISAITTDLLWRDIDFVALRDEGITCNDLLIAQGTFFKACDRIMDEAPDRWKKLASRVRSLRMVKVPSYAIPKKGAMEESCQWSYLLEASSKDRSIYHVMAEFEKLETLHFYIRESIDLGCDYVPPGEEIFGGGKLGNLRTVEIGGNIDADMLAAILSAPQKLEHLALINLQDGTAGQEYHSHPVCFLDRVADGFESLKRLHLSMLSQYREMDGREEQWLPWQWDLADDQNVFEDWGRALEATCATLEELTLESSYLFPGWGDPVEDVPVNFDELDVEGEENRGGFQGVSSSQRFRDAMLPRIASLKWPKLRMLRFVGVHVGPRALREAGVLDRLPSETEIHVLPGSGAKYDYEVTPLEISPPNGTFQDDNVDDRLDKVAHVVDRVLG